MVSTLSQLPAELLDRIFFFLPDRPDISSCRLVCKAFKEHSSPYLIRSVVFAKRLKDIKRLQEVLDHPYYSQYVTELTYDASAYHPRCANDRTWYILECQIAPRFWRGPEWEDRRSKDDQIFRELNHKLSQSVGARNEVPTTTEEATEDPYRDTDPQFEWTMRCNKSMPDYNALFEAQRRIEKADLPGRMIERCFTKLPSLKRVVWTDWRGLARRGESYDECAWRLFGDTLHPQSTSRLGWSRRLIKEFFRVISAITDTPGNKIQSFAFGSHPFQDWDGDVGSGICHEERSGIDIPSMIFSNGMHCTMQASIEGMTLPFCHLMRRFTAKMKYLELHFSVKGGWRALGIPYKRDFAQSLAPGQRLTHLAMKLSPIVERPGDDAPSRFEDKAQQADFFSIAVWGQRFPVLKSLHLEGWPLSAPLLEEFLSAHTSTLRILRIKSCYWIKSSCRPNLLQELSLWIGQNMQLDGIEWDLFDTSEIILDAISPDLLRAMNKTLPEKCSAVQRFEFLALAGRRNFIIRKMKKLDLDKEIVGYSEADADFQPKDWKS